MEHLWKILINDPELSHRNETSKIDDPSTKLHNIGQNYNFTEQTINPDINFTDFVSFLQFGIIPRTLHRKYGNAINPSSGSVHPNIQGKQHQYVTVQRSVVYARGAYMGWLHDCLKRKNQKLKEEIDREIKKISEQQKVLQAIGATKTVNMRWLEQLINIRSVNIALKDKLEQEFVRMSKIPIEEAYNTLWGDTDNTGSKQDINDITIHVDATAANPFEGYVNVLDAYPKYEQAILENKWEIEEPIEAYWTQKIRVACNEIRNAGVDEDIQKLLYTMAMVFIINPSTMFNTMSLNMVIAGKPGTGKSTLIDTITKLAYGLGWVCSDKCANVTKSDLISHQQGETALKTRSYLDGHIGQCIFMDEAYSFVRGDPGQEFADELTAFLTEHKGQVMVIAAGYLKEMSQDFLGKNIGMPRRFPTVILMREKSDRQLLTAFLTQFSNRGKRPSSEEHMGAYQEFDGIVRTRWPIIEDMAIWLSILCCLKTSTITQPLAKDTLLTQYFSDTTELATHFYRYSQLQKSVIDHVYPAKLKAKARQKVNVHKFDKDAMLNRTLHSWFLSKISEFNLPVDQKIFCSVTGANDHTYIRISQTNDTNLYNKLVTYFTKNKYPEFIKKCAGIMYQTLEDSGNFSRGEGNTISGVVGIIGAYKQTPETIQLCCKTGTVHLAFTKSDATTSFKWQARDTSVKDALSQAFGVTAAVSAANISVPTTPVTPAPVTPVTPAPVTPVTPMPSDSPLNSTKKSTLKF